MSLLSAIPGLSRHQSEPVRPVFDLDRAVRLIGEAQELLAGYYPAGALEWLRQMRPDVSAFLKQCERELDAAAAVEDMPVLSRALDRYVEAHRRAFAIYEAAVTPTIAVDEQGGLFP